MAGTRQVQKIRGSKKEKMGSEFVKKAYMDHVLAPIYWPLITQHQY